LVTLKKIKKWHVQNAVCDNPYADVRRYSHVQLAKENPIFAYFKKLKYFLLFFIIIFFATSHMHVIPISFARQPKARSFNSFPSLIDKWRLGYSQDFRLQIFSEGNKNITSTNENQVFRA